MLNQGFHSADNDLSLLARNFIASEVVKTRSVYMMTSIYILAGDLSGKREYYDAAFELLSARKDEYSSSTERSELFIQIAQRTKNSNHIEAALAESNGINYLHFRAEKLGEIAAISGKQEHFDLAVQTANLVGSNADLIDPLHSNPQKAKQKIVVNAVDGGHFDSAAEIIRQELADNPAMQAKLMTKVAAQYHSHDERSETEKELLYDEAIKFALNSGSPENMLSDMLQTACQAGDYNDAFAVAQNISDPLRRCESLFFVASQSKQLKHLQTAAKDMKKLDIKMSFQHARVSRACAQGLEAVEKETENDKVRFVEIQTDLIAQMKEHIEKVSSGLQRAELYCDLAKLTKDTKYIDECYQLLDGHDDLDNRLKADVSIKALAIHGEVSGLTEQEYVARTIRAVDKTDPISQFLMYSQVGLITKDKSLFIKVIKDKISAVNSYVDAEESQILNAVDGSVNLALKAEYPAIAAQIAISASENIDSINKRQLTNWYCRIAATAENSDSIYNDAVKLAALDGMGPEDPRIDSFAEWENGFLASRFDSNSNNFNASSLTQFKKVLNQACINQHFDSAVRLSLLAPEGFERAYALKMIATKSKRVEDQMAFYASAMKMCDEEFAEQTLLKLLLN